jgi:predicted DNA-binding antitoxin AbrB/MazE fold protein
VKTVPAIYERGVLRLQEPIDLPDGTRVEVIVVSERGADARTPAAILAEIAALPIEGKGSFSGRDHDRILYGGQDAP